ncbi:hypothetical protein [Thiomicrorhabdus sp.]|uniref:hypothetical protein n=1 Tax=Thiomicrorhabdus sp. TaxID=2039724 RepID=UPI0029C616B8|nr:hypothetical protein [Thiomicrorhabdus sp.]
MKLGILDLMLNEAFCCEKLAWGNHLFFLMLSAAFIGLCLLYWNLSQAATGILYVLLAGIIKVISNGIYSGLLQAHNPKLLDGI